ncbi:ral guanine nucleotide dissociation stimulator-like [Perognathus longimembris pacificus]|uniref:ral guanine nucleotide dissociation stimulator-like n=1 Tax=Perognathus longimembris pacificus TaxID=214514 RepID=UPI002018DFE9|nr:ral guanine nucleotide dissociation stimulator-like [Perognathus longimembris pacificus]
MLGHPLSQSSVQKSTMHATGESREPEERKEGYSTHLLLSGSLRPPYGRILAPTLSDPCKAGYIPGGKLEKLVDHLVPSLLFGDASFIPVFLGTYRTFSTPHQVLSLLFNRAFSFILGSWMKEYPEDFLQAQDATCLNQLVQYLHHNMPGSLEERQARRLLTQLEHMHAKQPELEAVPTVPMLADNASAQEWAPEALAPTPSMEAILPSQSYLELSTASEPPSAPGHAVELQHEPLGDGYSGSPAPSLMEPSAEPEPAPPPAREADMPAEVEPAPREFLDLEDFQVSSREPSQISMKDFENDLTRAHVLEWLPELKAEQFSLMAVELFKKLKPYHCLHYVRADPNDERQERLAPTVLAILTHCDQVASCVITTCLGDHSVQAAERAEVVEHWIEVALQCHLLRNVCSLFAVLSALQSSPLQGLKRTWRAVSRDSLAVFKELKRMFSKETIYKGRPSKYMAIWKKLRRGQRKPKELHYPEGTVPHLGTILTHLASLQKDKDSKNGTWISMKQRREEFKVMSLIKELQGTCQELHVVPEVNFVSWFTNLKRLSESECAKLSMELEPPVRACCLDRNPRWSPLMRKPSRHLQAPTRQLSRDGSSQVKTSDRLRSGTSSAPPTVQLGYSPRPYCHCYRLYQSAPNIYRSKILQEYDGILPLLSPQTFRRVGQEEIT